MGILPEYISPESFWPGSFSLGKEVDAVCPNFGEELLLDFDILGIDSAYLESNVVYNRKSLGLAEAVASAVETERFSDEEKDAEDSSAAADFADETGGLGGLSKPAALFQPTFF